MITSTASTPICRPQLPPEIVTNAGALQPSAVRQVATPLPPSAPNTNPPLTMCGITATHLACSNTSSGIPLSGIPIISCSTMVALSRRSVASSFADPAQHRVPRLNIANTNITFFIEQPHFCNPLRRPSSVAPFLERESGMEVQANRVTCDVSKSASEGLSNCAHSGHMESPTPGCDEICLCTRVWI